MKIRSLTEEEINGSNLISHAIINKPISYFGSKGIILNSGCDDLDEFDTYDFMLEYETTETPCALFQYKHYPVDDVTNLYLPFEFNQIQVDIALTKILSIFDLGFNDVYWQRTTDNDHKKWFIARCNIAKIMKNDNLVKKITKQIKLAKFVRKE